jgi:hypothetical protein
MPRIYRRPSACRACLRPIEFGLSLLIQCCSAMQFPSICAFSVMLRECRHRRKERSIGRLSFLKPCAGYVTMPRYKAESTLTWPVLAGMVHCSRMLFENNVFHRNEGWGSRISAIGTGCLLGVTLEDVSESRVCRWGCVLWLTLAFACRLGLPGDLSPR